MPFVHVEGPFISPQMDRAVRIRLAHVRDADIAEFERWQEASGGLVGLLTLSPHSDAAIDLVRHAAGQGVHVAIGHTDATPEQIHAAAAAGRDALDPSRQRRFGHAAATPQRHLGATGRRPADGDASSPTATICRPTR